MVFAWKVFRLTLMINEYIEIRIIHVDHLLAELKILLSSIICHNVL